MNKSFILFIIVILSSCVSNNGENIDCTSFQNNSLATKDSRKGKILIPDKQNFMTKFRLTQCDCWVEVSLINDATVNITSSFLKKPLRAYRINNASNLFINNQDKNNTYVVQLKNGLPVALTHTKYDKNNTLIYGKNGDGDYIKECGLLK